MKTNSQENSTASTSTLGFQIHHIHFQSVGGASAASGTDKDYRATSLGIKYFPIFDLYG